MRAMLRVLWKAVKGWPRQPSQDKLDEHDELLRASRRALNCPDPNKAVAALMVERLRKSCPHRAVHREGSLGYFCNDCGGPVDDLSNYVDV